MSQLTMVYLSTCITSGHQHLNYRDDKLPLAAGHVYAQLTLHAKDSGLENPGAPAVLVQRPLGHDKGSGEEHSHHAKSASGWKSNQD